MRNKDKFSKKELSLYIEDPYEIASATYTVYTEMEKQKALYEKYLWAFQEYPNDTTLEYKALNAKNKSELYHRLKERGIYLLIENPWLMIHWYHYCQWDWVSRDYCEFGWYGFHSDCWYSAEDLWYYNDDSYLHKKESMSLERAEQLLDYDGSDGDEEEDNEKEERVELLRRFNDKWSEEKIIGKSEKG
jgi:hypothetical protein